MPFNFLPINKVNQINDNYEIRCHLQNILY